MSSPPKSSISPSPSKKSTVHQKIASVLNSSSGGSNSKPFIKSKSQTTSSIVFPSFRFSPESEEIREVTNTEGGGEGDEGSCSSTSGADGEGGAGADGSGSVETPPTTTTKSGGDISPLKEYLLKHKWANKWDKRSLSLDLDLKGKLFTALEDKRKSFVSQFLNEDEEEDINLSVGDHHHPLQPMTPLTTSCSIPEQLVVGSSNNNASSTETDYGYDEDVSVRSDTVLFRHHSRGGNGSTTNPRRTYNFEEENCPDYFDYEDDFDDDYDVVVEEEITGSTNKKPTIQPLKLDEPDLKDNLVVVEEIGVDCCEVDDIMMLMGGEEGASTSRSSLLKEFVLPPESLQERFEGLPTLYNPPSMVIGLRKYPIQEIASTAGGGGDVNTVIDKFHEEDGTGEGVYYRKRSDRSDYTVRGLVRNILLDVVYHPWVKYWIGLLAAVVTLDFGGIVGRFIWFLLGVGATVICSRALWKGEWEDGTDDVDDEQTSGGSSSESLEVGKSSQVTNGNNATRSAFSLYSSTGVFGGKSTISTSILDGEPQQLQQKRASPGIGNGLKNKSQGWLLTLNTADPKQSAYPDYNPFRNHLRDTKTVFARLNGPYLTISVPHQRHRIPKRRLWSDPVINSEHIFIRHQQYDLTGAKVQVVPLGLAKKRVWCKKYPIGITFACSDKFCGELTGGVGYGRDSPVQGADGGDVSSGAGGSDTVGRVSFTKDEKGNEKVKVGGSLGEKPKGEVFKDPGSCCGKTIYLFARCDREKDDWFRRLIAASKIKLPSQPTSPQADSSPDFGLFLRYMQRACPTMMIAPSLFTPLPSPSSPRVTPTNDLLYENVSMHHISQNLQEPSSLPSSTSQASSRKSSPDKLESFHFAPAEATLNSSYLNALIGRLFYDFLQSERWNEKVKKLIDRKLYFIRKPAMVQSLKVKSLDFGDSLPLINHTSTPVLDSQGLWVDLDIGFVGNIVITLEAFINIMKMGVSWDEERLQSDLSRAENTRGSGGGSKKSGDAGNSHPSPISKSPSKHAMFDSEADDSGESSESDDDVDLEEVEASDKSNTTKPSSDNLNKSGTASNANVATGGRGKLLKYADSFAKSSVMRNKHVQKWVTGIAATPILLTVEIRRVVGSVAVNIPPVPNDRVWIGFRSNPVIDINVRPKVGQRVVSLSQVTEWIKKKILLEFQRVMVCPNMMDITIPLMEFQLPK